MENNQPQKSPASLIKEFMTQPNVTAKFQELLGKKSTGFITSVLQLCNGTKLAQCEPKMIYQAAAMAAMLDLPLNPNLGFAYIIPYKESYMGTDPNTGKPVKVEILVPQFQMGYKGFIQLAQRSGQFKNINVTDVKEGEIKEFDRLKGEIEFDWDTTPGRGLKKTIGFAGYFSLINGFEKTLYMSVEQMQEHSKKYSKTFNQNSSKWKTEFEAMATKTVIKLLLSKYAPLAIETIQQAAIADQAIIKQIEGGFETVEFEYIDNNKEEIEFDWDSLGELYHTICEAGKLSEEEKANCIRILMNKETLSYSKLQKMLQSK